MNMFGLGPDKKERKSFPVSVVKYTLKIKQSGKCAECGKKVDITDFVEAHHKDGDRSNNKPNNCQVIHKDCHARATLKQQYDKHVRKHTKKEEDFQIFSGKSLFEGPSILGPEPKGKNKNSLGFGGIQGSSLFGLEPKSKKRKQEDMFGFSGPSLFGPESKKKGKKKRDNYWF